MSHHFDAQWRFVQARHYSWVDPAKPRRVTLLECHSMESQNKPTTAEAVANWFASASSPIASPHANCDQDSIVYSVMPQDIAWACGASNECSYSVEFAGYAKETEADWLAPANLAMLKLGAAHLAKACVFFGIPPKVLTEEEVAECLRDNEIRHGRIAGADSGSVGGVTTHVMSNAAWRKWQLYGLPQPKGDLSHTDPGNGFPIDKLVEMMAPATSGGELGDVTGAPI